MNQVRPLATRVEAAAEETLAKQDLVTPIDISVRIGWLHPRNVDDWRRGRLEYLDDLLPSQDDRAVAFLVHLKDWAVTKGLKPVEADYVAATSPRRPLRFSSLNEPVIERAWRTHWVVPDSAVAPNLPGRTPTGLSVTPARR